MFTLQVDGILTVQVLIIYKYSVKQMQSRDELTNY